MRGHSILFQRRLLLHCFGAQLPTMLGRSLIPLRQLRLCCHKLQLAGCNVLSSSVTVERNALPSFHHSTPFCAKNYFAAALIGAFVNFSPLSKTYDRLPVSTFFMVCIDLMYFFFASFYSLSSSKMFFALAHKLTSFKVLHSLKDIRALFASILALHSPIHTLHFSRRISLFSAVSLSLCCFSSALSFCLRPSSINSVPAAPFGKQDWDTGSTIMRAAFWLIVLLAAAAAGAAAEKQNRYNDVLVLQSIECGSRCYQNKCDLEVLRFNKRSGYILTSSRWASIVEKCNSRSDASCSTVAAFDICMTNSRTICPTTARKLRFYVDWKGYDANTSDSTGARIRWLCCKASFSLFL